MKIAINTGGGDAPGLNAAIRSATLSAIRRGWDVVGIRNGYGSLFTEEPFIPLTAEKVHGITMDGGTILGTANRGNPFEMPYQKEDGSWDLEDRSDEAVEVFKLNNIDALVAIGGDGSMRIANRFSKKGIPVVGVPKTIDNDIWGCEISLGFDTAVSTATEAIDKITTTAESHRRIMVVEVMGRYAGWIALHSGLSASADVILIPEIEFSLDSIAKKILEKEEKGETYSIVVVAEGSKEVDGENFVKGKVLGQSEQLGGVAEYLEKKLSEMTGKESRSIVLGHLQRGGTPSTSDRLISLRFGAAAIRAIAEKDFNKMIVMQQNEIRRIPLSDVADKMKLVPLDGDTILTAREIGICLGD
ncbi:ATP-dependent 6-phosphofructokinase [Rhodohalobacter sp.]|uniref:6-phosphofructokinase n=1 Tax=Rhodohalobacter sp. TaxID=1974210 RepID=UPI002ACE6BE6|nr:ATP-dependent 6-phosphofructokinase [Rhodohalobacter sp.]MDZ7757793.1 ATP-dependent 6-phosphofructokinase [Rhodohalobacter sp.]